MPAVLEHRYRPRGTARELFTCRAPEALVSGAAGTGKSRGCLEKLLLIAKKYDGSRLLILRKTLASLGGSALKTWREHVAVHDLAAGEVWYYGGSAEEPPQYRFKNGSSIVIGGMDKPTRIMSTEYDVIYVQEATELTEDELEHIITRLRNGVLPYQQLLMDCNPSTPTHWLLLRCRRGTTVLLNSTHEENPVLFDVSVGPDGDIEYTLTERGTAYMAVLDSLTGVRYLRLRKGQWVAAEGMIYEDWDESVHVVDRWALWPETGLPPDDWARWWVVDFGFTNPFVCQFWAEDPDGRLYLYREIYRTKRTVTEHAVAIMACVSDPDDDWVPELKYASERRTWKEPKPRGIICDHDAAQRAELQRQLAIGTVKADKSVGIGIQEAQQRFKQRRMFICRDALVERDRELDAVKRPACTLEEIPGYIWDQREGRPPKEEPVKEDDHGCDCLRYLAKHRARGRVTVRRMGDSA